LPVKEGGAMTIFRITRAAGLAVVCLLATSTEAEIIWPPWNDLFAYARFYCEGVEVCDYYPSPGMTVVVTPFGESWWSSGRFDRGPAWSPDGLRIANWGNGDIFVIDSAVTAGPANITQSAAYEGWPAWSPDGTKIAFWSVSQGSTS
jgi:Tol biopolymer transport system component